MKILQIIREEIIPLSRRQNIVLLTIIACIFQFALFYAPALADAAVQEAYAAENTEELITINGSVVKEINMDQEAAKSSQAEKLLNSTDIITSSSSQVITSADPIATTSPKTIEKVIKVSTNTITAYNSEAGQTDDSPCITANGFNVCKHGVEDTIAANFLPFGTKVKIPDLFGDRVFVVRDRMNKKHPNRVDVWMQERSDAIKFGVKVAKIQVIE
jgi:3D (Asp-Asp-Asp) domain-containing protein